jgi:TRAP-type C4-dicarboxylate transport system permease small subunit
VRASINLVRPDWVRFRAYYSVFVQAAGLVVVYFLIKAGSWVKVADSAASGAVNYARTVQIVNRCFLYALVGTAVFSGVMILIRVMRLVRQPRGHHGPASVGARAKEGN